MKLKKSDCALTRVKPDARGIYHISTEHGELSIEPLGPVEPRSGNETPLPRSCRAKRIIKNARLHPHRIEEGKFDCGGCQRRCRYNLR